jgi:hypothetical protein
VIIQITVANTGGTAAVNVALTNVKLGTATPGPLPQNMGTIAAGASAAVNLTVSGSVGGAGVSSTLAVGGTYTGGTFTSSARITLP